MENQIVILKKCMALIIFCTAKAYEKLQRNERQVFSANLSSIFLVYTLKNSKEMTLNK